MSETAVDWEQEAHRIGAAFGVDDLTIEGLTKNYQYHECWGSIKITGPYCKGIYLQFYITQKGKPDFFQIEHQFQKRVMVFLDNDPFADEESTVEEWDFSFTDHSLVPYMVRGLVNLGFNPELLYENLKYEPSAHEKLEWALQYEKLTFEKLEAMEKESKHENH